MIRTTLMLGCSLLLTLSSFAHAKPEVLSVEQKLERVSAHNRAFQALNERIRDPFISKGPDGYYYLTGTTAGSFWGETIGIRLWRSKDLANWQDLGFVWELYQDVPKRNSWHFQQPLKHFHSNKRRALNPLAVWAPEIHYLNGTWWIPHSLNVSGHGLLKSTSGKAEGPYEVMPPGDTHGIDAHLYQEEGQTYYLWGHNKLAAMNQAMSDLSEPAMELEIEGKHPLGYEGILLLKVDDKYLYLASGRYGYEPTDTYDLYYAVSDQLKGPYGKRRMAVKHAGHGNLFKGPGGQWWTTAFDHPFYDPKTQEKWSLWLVPLELTVSSNDLVFNVKDERFRPTAEDQTVIDQLSIQGKPKAWTGHAHWARPESLKPQK